MIREFFYLQKSDRKVILTLLVVIAVALGVIFLTGEEQDVSNTLTPADTVSPQSVRVRESKQTVVKTRIVYRDRPSQRHYARRASGMKEERRDSFIPRYPEKIKLGEHVVLNTADTTALRTVPGIGPYFARKIVQYGERLGGYVSIDQLDEIEDFPVDAKDYLVIENAQPRKLNVNELSLNDLKRHPYINYFQAKAIMDYRRLHGRIGSIDDLRLSKDFPLAAIERLRPYLSY